MINKRQVYEGQKPFEAEEIFVKTDDGMEWTLTMITMKPLCMKEDENVTLITLRTWMAKVADGNFGHGWQISCSQKSRIHENWYRC